MAIKTRKKTAKTTTTKTRQGNSLFDQSNPLHSWKKYRKQEKQEQKRRKRQQRQ